MTPKVVSWSVTFGLDPVNMYAVRIFCASVHHPILSYIELRLPFCSLFSQHGGVGIQSIFTLYYTHPLILLLQCRDIGEVKGIQCVFSYCKDQGHFLSLQHFLASIGGRQLVERKLTQWEKGKHLVMLAGAGTLSSLG